jgi:hypothetical protein
MSTVVTNTAITPEWQNVYRKVFSDITSGGSSMTRALNLIYGAAPRSYSKDLYEFERKYQSNGTVPQVLRGGNYIDVSGEKKVIAQFNPLPFKLKSGYSVVDFQKMSAFIGEGKTKESFRADNVTDHIKRIKKALNANAIVSRKGGVVQTEVATSTGTIYTDQNFGLVWSDSVGAAAFPTKMQNGVTMTTVDWGNASTTLPMIEQSIADIFLAAEAQGLNTMDLDIQVGVDVFSAIAGKIDAYISTSRKGSTLDYSVDKIGGVITLGSKQIVRYNDSCVINGVTHKFVEDKYITVCLKPQYNDWVYMCPENVGFMYTPIEYFSKEVMDAYEENWEVLTQSRQFLCPDTNGIFTVKVVA